MTALVTFTLADACTILDPPITERQLRAIVVALRIPHAGYRHHGHRGHPHKVYNADTIMRLHGALVPFLAKAVL